MADWETRRLGDVAQLNMGQSPPGSRVTDLDGGLPFLQGNAEFGSRCPTATLQCDEAVRRSAPGDSLISVRAPVGAINRADRGYGIGRGLAAVTFDVIDPDFGHHALVEWSRDLQRVSQGTTFSAIGRTELAALQFPVPPLKEQRRIAEILDTIDETIQATERIIAKYERLIAGILQRASFGSLRAEEPTFALRDFCSLSAGLTPSRSTSVYYGGDVPWVKSGEVAGSAILTTEETVSAKAVNDLGLGIVRSGTPLIAMYGATAGAVGWLEIDAATNQAVLAVEPEADRADRRWLYWALRLGSGRMLASVQGSGQPNLSKQIIGATRMSLPDFQEQLAEVEHIDSAQASIEAQRAVVTKLRLTRTGLAADLLSGRARTVAA